MSSVRVRIAPSPTGRLHIGTARTALFNWLFAKKEKGAFILRIEDTDRERSKKEFEKDIFEGFSWLGLIHDELYRQSERTELYERSLHKMIDEGKAFRCGHTIDELEEEGKRQRQAHGPPRHICSHREEKRSAGIIRFKNDRTGTITVHDIVRGDVGYDAQLLGDFSIAKSAREPLYNFAAIADDADIKISHVIRGEDHLSNTPKQILIGESLGLAIPQWAHVPLLLGGDRSKLSKRHGALALLEYRDRGYLTEAMINFIALLGWHPKDEAGEILDRETLIREFSLERIQKGGAVVAQEKLDWLNKEYLKKISPEAYFDIAQKYVSAQLKEAFSQQAYKKALFALRSRIARLGDIEGHLKEILEPPSYEKSLLLWRGNIREGDARKIIDELIKIFSNIAPSEFRMAIVEESIEQLIQKNGKGNVLWPLRAALSGQKASVGPYELAGILGKEETQKRLQQARHILLQ